MCVIVDSNSFCVFNRSRPCVRSGGLAASTNAARPACTGCEIPLLFSQHLHSRHERPTLSSTFDGGERSLFGDLATVTACRRVQIDSGYRGGNGQIRVV